MRTAIYNLLNQDGQLSSILSGGVFDASTTTELSVRNTPLAFDANNEIKPCCMMRVTGLTPEPGPHKKAAGWTLEFYLYQRFGYVEIEQARERIFDLLDNRRIAAEGGYIAGSWRVEHTADVLRLQEKALGWASLEISRYRAIARRR